VFQQNVKSVSADDFAPFLWAFIDADACSTGVPEELVYDTNLYIMFTTSPKRDRWKPSDELYEMCSDHYEHLIFRRNTPSVSLLVSSLLPLFTIWFPTVSNSPALRMNSTAQFRRGELQRLGSHS
jgi:hypothetical protein